MQEHIYQTDQTLSKNKNIPNQSVGDFIRTIRLKKAIQIMTHEDIAINEGGPNWFPKQFQFLPGV
jgi:hypothetical protein